MSSPTAKCRTSVGRWYAALYLCQMVVQHTLRRCEGNQEFLLEMNVKFEAAVDANKILKLIEFANSLQACAPCSVRTRDKL